MPAWKCVRARAVCMACGRPAFFVPWKPADPGSTVTLDDMRVVYRNSESCALAEETLRVTEELEQTGRIVYAPGFCAGPYTVLQVWERAGGQERERKAEGPMRSVTVDGYVATLWRDGRKVGETQACSLHYAAAGVPWPGCSCGDDECRHELAHYWGEDWGNATLRELADARPFLSPSFRLVEEERVDLAAEVNAPLTPDLP